MITGNKQTVTFSIHIHINPTKLSQRETECQKPPETNKQIKHHVYKGLN